jgi:nucleotide-binding universal stress UspA family protein
MKILVPIDGSPASLRALDLAIDQAKGRPNSCLVVVNVQNRATLGLAEGAELMPPDWIDEQAEEAADKGLEKAATICRERRDPSAAPSPMRSIGSRAKSALRTS